MSRLFLCQNKEALYRAYTKEQLGDGPVCTWEELKAAPLSQTRYIFSTWGMPALSKEEIAGYFPKLLGVFYAAGSVQSFALPFLEMGIKVFSAWAANAVPVAEFTVAQILLANKGFFQLHRRYSKGHSQTISYAEGFPGNYGCTVGLLGAGMIGRRVIELLMSFKIKIMVFDPFLSPESACSLGVEKVELTEIFENCQTISNHLANNEQTRGMLNYSLFSKMKANASFINTGRGAQVVAEDLFKALSEEPGRTAVLDVTDPEEPLSPESPYWNYPNIILSPHRAGSTSGEILRMGEYMWQEYENLINNRPTPYEVSLQMLKTMA